MWWLGRSSRSTLGRGSTGCRGVGALALTAICLLATPSAHAQREDAQAIAEQARGHFVEGRYAEAAELYEEAFDLDPHPVILYNLARCYEELGDLPRALEQFRRGLELDPSEQVSEALSTKIAEIERLLVEQGYDLDTLDPETFVALARISITSLPREASVTLDGEPIGATPIENLFIGPGRYEIVVTLEGYQPHRRTISIEAGRNVVVHAGLRRTDAVTEYVPVEPGVLVLTGPRRDMEVYLDEDYVGHTPLSGTPVAPGRYHVRVIHPRYEEWTTLIRIESGETTRLYANAIHREDVPDEGFDSQDWGIVSMATGGALLITGVVFGFVAQADADRYHRNVNSPDRAEIRDQAISEALIADVSFGVAGAFVLTGALLYFLGGDDEDGYEPFPDDLVRWDVSPTPHGWSVTIGGDF